MKTRICLDDLEGLNDENIGPLVEEIRIISSRAIPYDSDSVRKEEPEIPTDKSGRSIPMRDRQVTITGTLKKNCAPVEFEVMEYYGSEEEIPGAKQIGVGKYPIETEKGVVRISVYSILTRVLTSKMIRAGVYSIDEHNREMREYFDKVRTDRE